MSDIIIIGNGASRRGQVLVPSWFKGVVVGCNQAALDTPNCHVSVSIDPAMTTHLAKWFTGVRIAKKAIKSDVVTIQGVDWAIPPPLGNGFGYDSGRLAIWAARKLLGHKGCRIYLLGFDMDDSRIYPPPCKGFIWRKPFNYHLAWESLVYEESNLILVSDKPKELRGYLTMDYTVYVQGVDG